MQRFVGILFLVFFAFPIGLSVAGCSKGTAVQYCPSGNGESGLTLGQVKSITLSPNLVISGESLSYGQIGGTLTASAQDCTGAAVSVSSYTYATTDNTIADINPTTGSVCAGTWNRKSGGGIGDYSICTPPPATNTKHSAVITAAASGATSNAIQLFIHAPVTSVSLGKASTNCTTDPASNCSACNPNLIGSTPPTLTPIAYDGSFCLSQNSAATTTVNGVTESLSTGQLVARVFDGSGNNISCQVGPLSFSLQGNTGIASVNATGIVTATQPGSALVTATVSNSSSALNAGFISVCPPKSITLTAVGQAANTSSINVSLNTPQSFTANVVDTAGFTMQGIALEFNSTLPVNIPTSGSTVNAVYPGSATITAVCQPPTCNPSPFSQIGLLGNGTPVTSNGITVTAPGTSSDVLYMGSLGSNYIVSQDFTTGQLGAPVKLPYTPTSMVISQDGSTIYMGSAGGLMTLATASGAVTSAFQNLQGNVLAVAPNNTYAVIADNSRGTVSLVTPSGTVFSTFNGLGTRAQWTPDSSTVYVTTSTNQLLTYSTFVGWQSTTIQQSGGNDVYTDVAVTVPSAGAYFARPFNGTGNTDGRSDCPSTTINTQISPATTTNVFTPLADQAGVPTDRLAFTTDGKHLLGATLQGGATLEDIAVKLPTQTVGGVTTIAPCPQGPINPGFFTDTHTAHALAGISATAINGVVPASNSAVAFVTYNGTTGTTSNLLPLYVPATGTLSNVTLSGGATAPVTGVFSTDNHTFYVGTAGDNVVHTVGVNGTAATDTGIINPALAGINGGTATPNLIVIRSRRSTS